MDTWALILLPLIGLVPVIVAAMAVRGVVERTTLAGEAWASAAQQCGLHFSTEPGPHSQRLREEAALSDLLPALMSRTIWGNNLYEDIQQEIWGDFHGGVLSVQNVFLTSRDSGLHSMRAGAFWETPLPLEFSIRRRGLFGLGTLKGLFSAGRSLKTGDQIFDRAFEVHSTRPDELSRVLTPEVRQALLSLNSHVERLEVNPRGIFWSRANPEKDADPMTDALRATINSSETFVRAAQSALLTHGDDEAFDAAHAVKETSTPEARRGASAVQFKAILEDEDVSTPRVTLPAFQSDDDGQDAEDDAASEVVTVGARRTHRDS